MHPPFLLSLALAGLAQAFLPPALSAQTVGGTEDLGRRFNGLAMDDEFGFSVSDAGDVDGDGFVDLIVGAPGADPKGLSAAGSAFVFSGATGEQLWRFDGLGAGDYLGWSVAGAGDVNGDGFDDLIAGAVKADPNGLPYSGSVFVFSGATGEQIWRFNGLGAGDRLGWSVAGAGDLDGDGFNDFIVGAPYADPNKHGSAGSAFVFSGASGLQLFQFDGLGIQSFLGKSVARAGDVDGDGVPDLIVGAYGAHPHGLPNAGSAFVFSGATGARLLRFDGLRAFDLLGYSVGGAGDVDGDGFDDMIVGSPGAAPNGLTYAGSAFVFSGATGAQLWRLDGKASSDHLGHSVDGAGDIDGDGLGDVIVGAPFAHPSGIYQAGSTLVFSGATGTQLFRLDGLTARAALGFSVSRARDVDRDGVPDLIIGAPLAHPNGLSHAGSAFVYTFNPILTASADVLSVTSGGRIDYAIDFPDVDAGASYQILLSAHGTGPTTLNGLLIPLTRDKYFHASRNGKTPSGTSGFQGILNENGKAIAHVTVPPFALPLKLLGHHFPITLVVINSNFDFCSVARTLNFTL